MLETSLNASKVKQDNQCELYISAIIFGKQGYIKKINSAADELKQENLTFLEDIWLFYFSVTLNF